MKLWVIVALISSLGFAGCSKGKGIQFCEGVTPDGEGVNCGVEFETGELTAVITSERPFGQEKIDIEVYDIGGSSKQKLDTVRADVKAAESAVNVTLPFYTEGKYLVSAKVKDESISEGEIKITDY